MSLWPEDILCANTPITILKEQGEILGMKTNGLVEGFVRAAHKPENLFKYSFYLYALALDYPYNLLSISHTECFYPVDITVDKDIYEMLPAGMVGKCGIW